MRRLTMLALSLPLLACAGLLGETDTAEDKDDEGGNPFGDTDTDTDADKAPDVTVTWSSRGATITIEGGNGAYDLGIAETGMEVDGWYGESCIEGNEPRGYDDYGFDVCHALSRTGGELESVESIEDVGDGRTLFNSALAESGRLTYALFADSGDCWAWGGDWRYYEGEGCTELE